MPRRSAWRSRSATEGGTKGLPCEEAENQRALALGPPVSVGVWPRRGPGKAPAPGAPRKPHTLSHHDWLLRPRGPMPMGWSWPSQSGAPGSPFIHKKRNENIRSAARPGAERNFEKAARSRSRGRSPGGRPVPRKRDPRGDSRVLALSSGSATGQGVPSSRPRRPGSAPAPSSSRRDGSARSPGRRCPGCPAAGARSPQVARGGTGATCARSMAPRRPPSPPATHGSRPRRCCPRSRRPRRTATRRGCSARSGTGTGPPRTPWPALRGRRGCETDRGPCGPGGGQGLLRRRRGGEAAAAGASGTLDPDGGEQGSWDGRPLCGTARPARTAGVRQLRDPPCSPTRPTVRDPRRHTPQGAPQTRRDPRRGAAGTGPSCSQPLWLGGGARGPRKRIVRRGGRPAPLTAATERVSTTRIVQLTPNRQ